MDDHRSQLLKVLELERAKGYADRAVIGGLDAYLRRWQGRAEAGARGFPLPTPSYAALSPSQRRGWLKKAVASLTSSPKGAAPKKDALPQKQPPKASPPLAAPTLASPITSLPYVSRSLAAKFERLGVATIQDLLYFFPRRHSDLSQVTPIAQLEVGQEQTIVARLWQASAVSLGHRLRATEAIVGDETGNIRVVWFNQPYLAKRLPTEAKLILSGRVGLHQGRLVLQSPQWEPLRGNDLTHAGRLLPIYRLTAGLPARSVRRLVRTALDRFARQITDFLPASVRERCQLIALPQALRQIHFPLDPSQRDEARRRLAFDELFLIQLGVLSRRQQRLEEASTPLEVDDAVVSGFTASLPFPLTGAQQRSLGEVLADLRRPQPMARLLQGDVGSGKTVVATAAMLATVAAGHQAVLMAPTEILAEQHFGNICALFQRSGNGEGGVFHLPYMPKPIAVALLTGSTPRNEKERVYRTIASGWVDLVIGTHALIQERVEFARLGLAVVDEQHRFGVLQRAALRQKGFSPSTSLKKSPHLLVMSATPIPRTLALTIHGDLDLSLIDEMPPGRQPIETRWLPPEQRQGAYHFVRDQIAGGRQAFVICPLVEESEAIEAKAAVSEYERLSRQVFPHLRLGLLHGRMSGAEKDAVMRRFQGGELDILVSTPVVEVGIDVPNATVMLIEGADRFGLSQLHQFRGRVGRGEHRSYCLLLAENPSQEARERLSIIEGTQDGFALAEEDLRLRGPGEFFGTRQSGLPELRIAQLSDLPIIELARGEALHLLERDPALEQPEHRPLAEQLARLWRSGADLS